MELVYTVVLNSLLIPDELLVAWLFEKFGIKGYLNHVNNQSYIPGMILDLNKTDYKHLKRSRSLKVLKNLDLTHTIPFLYSSQNKVCILPYVTEIEKNTPLIPKIVKILRKELGKEIIVWCSVKKMNSKPMLETLAITGFSNPYVTTVDPSGKEIDKAVAMTFTGKCPKSYQEVLFSLESLFETEKNQRCFMNILFSDSSIEFLQSLPMKFRSEISGNLFLSVLTEEKGKVFYVVDVRKTPLITGGVETVDVTTNRYSFHSHPEQAYINHSVTKGWPSASDFYGFVMLSPEIAFHCVSTLEGLYIISFSSDWVVRLHTLSEKFIRDHFTISQTEIITPQEYTQKVSRITKDGKKVFDVQFSPWEKVNSCIFQIFYHKTEDACLPTQESVDVYNRVRG